MYQRKRKKRTSQKTDSAERLARKKEKKEKKLREAEALAALHFWQGAPKTKKTVFVEDGCSVSRTIEGCLRIGGTRLENELHELFNLSENSTHSLVSMYHDNKAGCRKQEPNSQYYMYLKEPPL
jgi:hypothetical protein